MNQLATRETEARCLACGGLLEWELSFRGVDRLHRTRGTFEVRCCSTCGSGLTFPIATPAEMIRFYPGSYGPYDDTLGAITGVISRTVRRSQGRRALRSLPLSALRDVP